MPSKSKPADLTLMQIMEKYSTEDAAREYFERLRWPEGVSCPHCGNCDDDIYKLTPNPTAKVRAGLYKCGGCKDTFTVRVGTVMEDSKIPLHKWLVAFYIMCASKTQVSALQLQRQLALGSYRSAWFLCHRIRFALMDSTPADLLRGTVEADETYIGGKAKGKGRGYVGNKTAVVSLVERNGRVRSQVMGMVNGKEITKVLRRHVEKAAILNTDESAIYAKAGKEFAAHDTVNHKDEEYAKRDPASGRLMTTNTAEGFFGNSKRSIDGTHHHISRAHTDLYFAELDYKYNTRKVSDGARTDSGIVKMEGKRLMLRRPKAGK